ncbi:unnamed protein product [Vitrella brassicaformis CCMP3155]|uniref:Uncharacterized protein n=1 Tax=Vitrella brassicaformis (strain CCMP3155) TaxID=1169540 RepID=A0A0G4F6U7_VITBC|nr:unnamed protein product [Vitrella brassicaformis CCMP3155]|eukprot:CEM07743.1 unnamed protein product [Vitrella brassicaformis CCMP3155]
MLNPWRWLKALLTTLATCHRSTSPPQQHDDPISASDVPEEAAVIIAEYVRSYSQLEALIDAHPTQFTTAVLLPILTRLLPAVVEDIFGAFVQVAIPKLSQDAAVIVAITRRLMMLEDGRDLARWRPHLELLYHLRGKRPVVLGDGHFEVFGSQTGRGFIGETEAVRQWKILSRGVTVHDRGQQRQLMDGDWILHTASGYRLPALLTSASPLFPRDTVDPANPPTQLDGWTYRNYASLVAFSVFNWLRDGRYITFSRDWSSWCPASAASLRVCQLRAAPPSDAAQWGNGVAVFDQKYNCRWHLRLVCWAVRRSVRGTRRSFDWRIGELTVLRLSMCTRRSLPPTIGRAMP